MRPKGKCVTIHTENSLTELFDCIAFVNCWAKNTLDKCKNTECNIRINDDGPDRKQQEVNLSIWKHRNKANFFLFHPC